MAFAMKASLVFPVTSVSNPKETRYYGVCSFCLCTTETVIDPKKPAKLSNKITKLFPLLCSWDCARDAIAYTLAASTAKREPTDVLESLNVVQAHDGVPPDMVMQRRDLYADEWHGGTVPHREWVSLAGIDSHNNQHNTRFEGSLRRLEAKDAKPVLVTSRSVERHSVQQPKRLPAVTYPFNNSLNVLEDTVMPDAALDYVAPDEGQSKRVRKAGSFLVFDAGTGAVNHRASERLGAWGKANRLQGDVVVVSTDEQRKRTKKKKA